MACAVRSCRNDIYRRKDLSFFSLPRQHHLKDEWLEILGLGQRDCLTNIKVCELHFKPKDFCTGKKQLKTHAVPVLRLGTGKSEPIDSDDEFLEYNSDSEPEVIEITSKNISAVKEQKIDMSIKQEIDDTEEGRRPSRRAAREAAKKIYNTVRSYAPKVETKPIPQVTTSFIHIAPHPYQRQQRRFSTKIVPINVNLVMECHEEILSPVQAEALLKAQLEYNMVMKTLRSLKANNVRIICSKDEFPPQTQTPINTSTIVHKVGSNSLNSVNSNPNSISQKPAPIVPMVLSASSLHVNLPSPSIT